MADDDLRDQRDDQIRSLLEVDPLDDVTRRRLVSTALRATPAHESGPSRSRRWLAAAAVLVVVVGGGTALLATAGDGHDDQPTAAPVLTPAQKGAESAGPATPSAAPGAPQADSQTREAVPAPAFTGPPFDAGDFGDLTRRANLDRLRAAFGPSALVASGTDGGRGEQLSASLTTRKCAVGLPAGTLVALGTGHFGSRQAIVVVTAFATGERAIDAVISHPCEVRRL